MTLYKSFRAFVFILPLLGLFLVSRYNKEAIQTTRSHIKMSAGSASFLDAVRIRRSILAVNKTSPISDDNIVSIVQDAIKHAPSAFSINSARAVVLFGGEHDKLWDIAMKKARETMPPQVFATLEEKIQGHHDSYGTVLFFEDSAASKQLPQALQDILVRFPDWYEHAQGMNQYIAWTALAAEGLGCSLQHNQIGKEVVEEWNLPESWVLRAQLVFGTPTGPPRGGVDKAFAPLEDRVLVYGA